MNPVLIEVLRGSAVESLHAGALAIVDASGAVHTALGDIDRPIFPRSAVKLLQALPLVGRQRRGRGLATDRRRLGPGLRLAVADHDWAATAPGLVVRISVGIAGGMPPLQADKLLKRADEALYAAKRAGRNRAHVD